MRSWGWSPWGRDYKRSPESSQVPSTMRGHSEKVPLGGSPQIPDLPAPRPWPSGLQNREKQISVAYKPSSLCYVVMAARTDYVPFPQPDPPAVCPAVGRRGWPRPLKGLRMAPEGRGSKTLNCLGLRRWPAARTWEHRPPYTPSGPSASQAGRSSPHEGQGWPQPRRDVSIKNDDLIVKTAHIYWVLTMFSVPHGSQFRHSLRP